MKASRRIVGKVLLGLTLLTLGAASAEPPPSASQTPGQMRGVSNAQRRAAAARVVDRKLAAGQKNQAVQHPRPHRKAR